MTEQSLGRTVGEWLRSPAIARAFTHTTLGAAFGAFAIERLAGRVAYVTIIAGLCVLAISLLYAHRREIPVARLAPISLVIFLAWTVASIAWSSDRSKSLAGWIALVAFALLAITIAHVRDTIQTVRALGDVSRWLLSISLGAEILFGILLDTPFRHLGIQGLIAELGPIQGIFGTRNALGFVAILALITFVVEWRTASVPTGLSVFSVALAGGLAVLSDSPTVLVIAAIVAAAAIVLALVRRTPRANRRAVQITIGAITAALLGVMYIVRAPLIAFLGAGSDFSMRADLWNSILDYVRVYPVQGWGWFGGWSLPEYPFLALNLALGERHASALNAYFDVLLQVGWLGLILFALFCAVALVRGWAEAGARRSAVYMWTPLILVALLVDSMFESFTLFGYGWLLLVLCATLASKSRSWRDLLRTPTPPPVELPPDDQDARGEAR